MAVFAIKIRSSTDAPWRYVLLRNLSGIYDEMDLLLEYEGVQKHAGIPDLGNEILERQKRGQVYPFSGVGAYRDDPRASILRSDESEALMAYLASNGGDFTICDYGRTFGYQPR